MKSSALVAPFIILCIGAVSGTPLGKRDDVPTVTQTLQFALTLEHLEDAYYTGALAKFSEADFEKDGLPHWVRGRISEISQHEKTHVGFLTDMLGADAVAPCTYNFKYTDPRGVLAMTKSLETVGTDAYLGAAQFLSGKRVMTAAASILATEARQAAWANSAGLNSEPWSGSFETPLSPSQAFTIASQYIASCPSSNPTLPFKAFPALTIAAKGTPALGKTVKLAYEDSGSDPRWLAIMSGLETRYFKIDGDHQVAFPDNLQGVVYAVVTSSDEAVTDASTIAGPAMWAYPFPSSASNP
ncbi:ferritin-like domain-containing protein [Phellopilus nigrolimitatus]|nr:ferritin-like domain-containing protein [Phellopilus nigrolimitatus]